jgi:Tol biopolymer transport system component
VTTDPDYEENASWSPDGRRLAFEGHADKFVRVATLDGSMPVQQAVGPRVTLGAFLPEGRALLFSQLRAKSMNDLAIVPLDRPNQVIALSEDPGHELQPAPAPDSRWIAFVTDRTGRPEVVIGRLIGEGTTFRLGQRLPVSSTGGIDPAWRQDGREIVYLAPDSTLMAVSVTSSGEGVALGKPTPLFRLPADAGGWGSNWAASANFTKFLLVEARHATTQRVRLLTDWTAGK